MEQRIEDYFNKQLSASEKEEFENELKTNPDLAESVAFYLLVKQTAKEDTREKLLAERHAEWQALPKNMPSKTVSRPLITYAAAAVILIALGLGWYFLTSGIKEKEQLADAYVQENFATLSIQMDGHADSLQQAIGAYNKGDFKETVAIAEAILKRDPQNAEVQKIAGIASLKLKDYDKAITYFHQLGEQKDLYSNPGRFYEAIAHLQRGLPLDKKAADDLLKEVVDSNLEGKEEVEKWVK
jgi:tetratricopeptide (TPR) repeat protein